MDATERMDDAGSAEPRASSWGRRDGIPSGSQEDRRSREIGGRVAEALYGGDPKTRQAAQWQRQPHNPVREDSDNTWLDNPRYVRAHSPRRGSGGHRQDTPVTNWWLIATCAAL